jgi:hypothetical protein
MNNDIQTGDTVEVVHDCFAYWNCGTVKSYYWKQGDRVVVTRTSVLFIYYTDANQNEWRMLYDDVKKVTTNQVEIKFR